MSHFFYINCLQNPNTYVLLSIKKYFLSWNQKYTCVLFCFSFLEILASCILTFSGCGCKRGITCRSQGSYWPLWPQCHLGSVENNNPRRSLCPGFCLCQQDHVHSSTLDPFSQILSGLMDRLVPQLTSQSHVTA